MTTQYMKRVRFGPTSRTVMCAYTGKRRYETESVAKTALKQVRKKRFATGKKKKERAAYFCVMCMNYHLTSEAK